MPLRSCSSFRRSVRRFVSVTLAAGAVLAVAACDPKAAALEKFGGRWRSSSSGIVIEVGSEHDDSGLNGKIVDFGGPRPEHWADAGFDVGSMVIFSGNAEGPYKDDGSLHVEGTQPKLHPLGGERYIPGRNIYGMRAEADTLTLTPWEERDYMGVTVPAFELSPLERVPGSAPTH